jgi:hypothetical protein
MDLVTVSMALTTVMTGAFGILGLYKDKETHRDTVWRRVSLIGILASTTIGVATQIMEARSQVRQLLEILSPLDDPKIDFTFEIPCNQSRYVQVCQTFSGVDLVSLRVNIFADSKGAQEFINGHKYGGDFAFDIGVHPFFGRSASGVQLGAITAPVLSLLSDGKLKSVLDLPEATIIISSPASDVSARAIKDLTLTDFVIHFHNGEFVSCRKPFEKLGAAAPGPVSFRSTILSQTDKSK